MNDVEKLEIAQKFFEGIYQTHQPSDYGSCEGEHEGGGYEYESPRSPCDLHSEAAKFLELPVIEFVRKPYDGPRLGLIGDPLVARAAWAKMIAAALSPASFEARANRKDILVTFEKDISPSDN